MATLDPITQHPIPEPEPEIPWAVSISAGMQRQNPLSRFSADEEIQARWGDQFSKPIAPDYPAEEGYSPYDDPATQGHDPQHFTKSYSPQETLQIIYDVKRNQQLIREAGFVGELAGLATNPILLAPIALTGGMSLPATIAIEGGAELLNETILHSQQPLRTMEESAWNVGGVMAFTGVVGGISAQLAKAPARRALTDDEVREFVEAADAGEARSAGAAQVFETTAEAEKMVGGKGMEFLAQGPLARVLSGASVKAKVLAQRIADVPFILKKHTEGKTFGPSIEARVGKYEGLKYRGYVTSKGLYKEYKIKNPSGMKFRDFDMEVGRALSQNDLHAIPQVQQAAKWYRQNVLDPLLKDAQDMSLLKGTKKYYADQLAQAKLTGKPQTYIDDLMKRLDEAPEKLHVGAPTYFPRVFNTEAIIKGYDKLHTDITNKLASSPDVDFLEAQGMATDIIRNLMGGDPIEAAAKKVIPKASALKERTLTFTDEFLDPYLEKEASTVLGRHSETVGREIEFAKEFSNKQLADEMAGIADEYTALISKAKSEKARSALAKEKSQVMTDLAAMRDRLHGIYGRPVDPSTALVRAGRYARVANAMAMLGGVTISSLADVARPLMMQGLKPYMKGIAAMGTNWKQFNLSRNEMKRWGVGTEAALGDARLAQMADVNSLDAGPRKWMDRFGKATGISYWNSGWKQFTGVIASDAIIGAALSKSVPGSMVTRMARAGINADGLKAIRKQFDKHGTTDQGLRLANTHLWDDDIAREVLESAIRSEVNMTIVTPGIGDAPLFMSTEVGKIVSQFKSFLMSATNRMLINGLQRRDVAVLQGTIAAVSMGALVGGIKAELRGEDTSDWTVDDWATEGVDRSGVLGIYNVPVNWAHMLRGKTPSRNLQRSMANAFVGDVFGPSLSQVERVSDVAADLVTGEADDRTREQAIRLIPFQNLLHLRQLAERAIE